jgi:hypothetical protein
VTPLRRTLRLGRRVWHRLSAPVRDRIAVWRELARLPEPVTFNEKVRYRMLADRRPLLTTFADKVAVRGYVESRVGGSVLTEFYAVTDDPTSLVRAELPREFAIKPTHASGACIVVADYASAESEVPLPTEGWVEALVQPDRVSWSRLLELCEEWLARSWLPREWAYRNVPPQIIVEELLDEGGKPPLDYKIFVFDGRARMIQVTLDRFEQLTRAQYTAEWERFDVV